MDEDMQAIDVADFEIERRLDSYARARLNPDPQTVARIRARVMREARLQLEPRALLSPPAAMSTARAWRIRRRAAMPLLAASVWLGVSAGSIFAAQPGGPLYPTRIWIESVALPSGGTARAEAELTRLDARLAEVVAASASGNAGSVEAALAAYGDIADEAAAGALGDPVLEDIVAGALAKHQVVLADVAARLSDKGNVTAAASVEASLQRAMGRARAVIDRVGVVGSGPSTDRPGSGSGGSAGGGNGGSNGGGNGGSNGGSTSGGGSNTSGGGSTTGGGSNGGSNGGGGAGGAGGGSGNGSGGSSGAKPTPTTAPVGPDPTTDRTPKPTPDHEKPSPTPEHTPRSDHGG
jgi:hypothetical protein